MRVMPRARQKDLIAKMGRRGLQGSAGGYLLTQRPPPERRRCDEDTIPYGQLIHTIGSEKTRTGPQARASPSELDLIRISPNRPAA